MYDETTVPLALKGVREKNGKSLYGSTNEEKPNLELTSVMHVNEGKSYIRASHVCAKWNPDSEDDFLKDVTFDVNQNELTVIIGPVGSGKVSDTIQLRYFC